MSIIVAHGECCVLYDPLDRAEVNIRHDFYDSSEIAYKFMVQIANEYLKEIKVNYDDDDFCAEPLTIKEISNIIDHEGFKISVHEGNEFIKCSFAYILCDESVFNVELARNDIYKKPGITFNNNYYHICIKNRLVSDSDSASISDSDSISDISEIEEEKDEKINKANNED